MKYFFVAAIVAALLLMAWSFVRHAEAKRECSAVGGKPVYTSKDVLMCFAPNTVLTP